MRFLKRWWWLLPAVLILILGGFLVWAGTAAAPMPEALAALQSDAQVEVDTDPWLVFRPVAEDPAVGLVFYPGGRVDPRAYAPAARALAQEGYVAVIVPMPLNLAFFAPDRAAEVMAAFPQVQDWAVGGHSLGGAMSARFAYQNPEMVGGLALWAAYPASGDDLSRYSLVVTSIYGTLDGLATEEKIEASRPLLPPDTSWVAIEGGNHAQFGWYGPQSGDNPATISRAEQQEQVVAATLALLSDLADRSP
ncbi:MAG: alpha/beta hydrolase [Anaerolineae bacterium]|nr:alpha/beta hydrolase [Anaerolineae bacterium]